MKRVFVLLLAFLPFLPLYVSAQNRLVLVEEFTNTGCGPCASWSPVLDSVIHYRLGDCIAIKYHSGYPDRNDPFYLYDREAHQAKVDFYQVTGVPTTFVDGYEVPDRSFAGMNTAITMCLQRPMTYDLTIEKQLLGRHLSATVSLTPLADTQSDNLRLFVAAIEERIVAATPYPNGETELNYTMRKMLTSPQGAPLMGLSEQVSTEWDIDFFDDLKQLGVVAYVQDISTREIMATAYSGPDAEGENRLALANLLDTPDLICRPDYSGRVILRNDGANAITTATLNVSVNGSVEQYPWTGNLNYLQRDTMNFGPHTNFELVGSGTNQVKVWFSTVNGTAASSDTIISQFSNAVQATYGVRLKIYTDKKPEETTWQLLDSQGIIVRQGGPYTEARKFITEDFDLRHDDCYQLLLLDAGGDGIKGAAGNGYYQLFQLDADGKQTRLTQGDYSGASHIVNFSLTGTPAPDRPRLVLFEEFTNTSCDPCAEFSPALDQTVFDRMGEMVTITYHWNFPSATDPFYLQNPTDVLQRANFYGISGVPALFVDGQHAGAWGYENQLGTYIDISSQVESTANLYTQASIDADNQLHLQWQVACLTPQADHDLRLFAAVVEERLEQADPAPNGERSWNYVLRKLLPSAEGLLLPANFLAIPLQYDYTWPISGFNDEHELGIVSFIQDMQTKAILCTTYTPRPTGSPRAMKILKVSNTPQRICTPQFTADLMLRNTGTETLHSAVINVSINGSVQRTEWSGELEPLGIVNVRTPLFTDFALTDEATNQVEVWMSDLNGVAADESVHFPLTIANAHSAQNAVRLTIMTDQKPEETTWAVLNSAGDVVCQGGPYTEPRKKVVIDLPLTVDDCYLLELEDAGGDGITGDFGRGYYMLHQVTADGKTRLMVQDTYTDALHDVFFSLQNTQPSAIVNLADQSDESDQSDLSDQFTLGGRPVSGHSPITIKKNKKIINNK